MPLRFQKKYEIIAVQIELREKIMYIVRNMITDQRVNNMTFETITAALQWRMSMGRTFMGETWVDFAEAK
jgi:predicted RNA-binding Zn ribbon-like protein